MYNPQTFWLEKFVLTHTIDPKCPLKCLEVQLVSSTGKILSLVSYMYMSFLLQNMTVTCMLHVEHEKC